MTKLLNTMMNPLDLFIWLLDKLFAIFSHKKRHYVHSRDRRSLFAYKKKREIVKNVWTVALIIMIIVSPYPFFAAAIFVISLMTTIISFAILDETIDNRVDK